MPKLPAVIESLDKVEEPFRSAYVEKEGGGGYVLDADVEAHPSVAGLRSAKDSAATEKKRLAKQLEAFKDVDPERYRQLVKEAEDREAAGGGPTDAEKLRKKLEADIRKELEPTIRERDELKVAMEKHQLFDVADAAALKGGVLPERLDDARKVYADFIRLNAGKKVEVLDDEGEPSGETLEKFFAERFKKQKPWFYAGSGASGGGATGGGGSGGGDAEVRKLSGAGMVEAAFAKETTKTK